MFARSLALTHRLVRFAHSPHAHIIGCATHSTTSWLIYYNSTFTTTQNQQKDRREITQQNTRKNYTENYKKIYTKKYTKTHTKNTPKITVTLVKLWMWRSEGDIFLKCA